MTRPLNEDGSLPLKRRVEFVLRVKEGNEVKHEIVRLFKAKWKPEKEVPLEAIKSGADFDELINDSITECFKPELSDAIAELMAWAKANMK